MHLERQRLAAWRFDDQGGVDRRQATVKSDVDDGAAHRDDLAERGDGLHGGSSGAIALAGRRQAAARSGEFALPRRG